MSCDNPISIFSSIVTPEYKEKPIVRINRYRRILGSFDGKGSFGKVISNPRAPFDDEDVLDLININQVSKIYNDVYDYQMDLKFYTENRWIFSYGDYLVLPLEFGEISRDKTNDYELIYRGPQNPFYNLSRELQRDRLFQITYNKGYHINNTTKSSVKFLIGINKIIKFIKELETKNLYLPDLKLQNIVDVYEYPKHKEPYKFYKSDYKIIDYTLMIDTRPENIMNSIDVLFYTEDKIFETGVEYPCFPMMPILAIKYIINDINLGNMLEYLEEDNDETQEIKTVSSESTYIIEDSLSNCLLEYTNSYTFKNDDYVGKVFNLKLHKLPEFEFEIKLMNLQTNQIEDYIINKSNINKILNFIVHEKNGYINKDERCWKTYLENLEKDRTGLNVQEDEFSKSIYKNRENTILDYSFLFTIYLNTFIKMNTTKTDNEKLKLLLDRIQLYSFGVFLLDFIHNNSEDVREHDDFISSVIELIVMSCLTIFYDEEKNCHYYNTNDFNDIHKKYIDSIKKIHKIIRQMHGK